MTKTNGLVFIPIFSILVLFGCGSNGGEDKIDYAYELELMQEQGWIDSTGMSRALANPNLEIRDLAVRTCGIVRDRRFAFTINSLCNDSQPEISAVVFALGEIRDSSSIEVLFRLLKSSVLPLRAEAIDALGKIGNRAAAERLRSLLSSPGYRFSELPLALWRIGDTLSVPNLKKMALDPEETDCFGAAYALFRLAPDSGTGVFLDDFACKIDSESVSGMDKKSYCADIQPIAARGLGDGKDTTATLQAFDNYYGSIVRNARIELIRALGKNKIGRERLEKILAEADDDGLKQVILTALGQIGDARSLDLMTRYLNDRSLQVRLAAISSLPETDKNKSIEFLEDLSLNLLWQIRAEVARALGKIGTPPAEKRLKQMLSDEDDRVRLAVIESLGKYPISHTLDLVKAAMFGATDAAVRSVAAEVLGSSKDPGAFDFLVEAAGKIDSNESIDFCRSLVAALGNYVDSSETGHSAIAAILPFLNHHDRIVRQDAAAALREFAPANFDPGKFDVMPEGKQIEIMMALREEKPIARISTARGEIIIELDPLNAPRTVANFVKLAQRKFYDGLTFHRVVQDFVIQGGCPRGDGWGDPGYMIREEINPIRFQSGTIGMATSGRDTGGSQFFICLSPQPHLDGHYTAFGRVRDGWEVADDIQIGDTIYSVTIEKGR